MTLQFLAFNRNSDIYQRFVEAVYFAVNIDEWRARTFVAYVHLSFPMYQWNSRMEPL